MKYIKTNTGNHLKDLDQTNDKKPSRQSSIPLTGHSR